MLDAFTDIAKVMRSHIPAANAPARIDVPKRGKLPGSKDSQPRKRKMTQISDPILNSTIIYSFVPIHEIILNYGDDLDETTRPLENREISVHYVVLDEV
ncbi:hypothetical protein ACFX15_023602 [Malus domestica]